ncbi:2-amino-4-hydroxy-6-hydroxymethyldihydropteridinediphosphokinase [Micromonospora pallida]|uniref:2-amino-4-hydroxy-6-hydroxymethyldihydropteridine diphosphokinase n=1 Tax=Micromonospora pallida TaxID=145854 RepID=A0A1C6TEY0_9ACTN|nr:2-amino-4-hydroxy-6-hydroxymethyldihydropteridine diphosphokinase [Micromonospora pallida]SCL40025.1 2-amino-4-hydroxy-6-hydroxymethyldihydropteridinediphosphokinase [Micromonospora pallida]
MTRAVLSLGSNLGDRLAHLRTGVACLGDAVRVVSGVYETPPWGDTDQPAYLNAVLLAEDPAATARDWLDRARDAEQAAGRVRDPGRRFGPRTLDVDVVAVWDDADEPVLSDDPELTLPHPRAHQRAFVLRPWIDIQPYGRLPGHGWLTDLLTAEPVAGDTLELRARPELRLESTA